MTFATDNQILFTNQMGVDGYLRSIQASVSERVNKIPADQFLNTPEQDLVDHIAASMRVEPLAVYLDSKTMEEEEGKADVSRDFNRFIPDNSGPFYVNSLKITVHLPIAGDSQLWTLRPNPCRMVFPRGNVVPPRGNKPGTLAIVVNLPSDSAPDAFKRLIDENIENLTWFINTQKVQIDVHNAQTAKLARDAVMERHRRLQSHSAVRRMLDIPLKPRAGTPSFTPIRIEKLVKPLPPAPPSGFKAEPGIADDIYELILNVIRHEGRTWETAPATYAKHDEEELRNIILSHLNTHVQGAASGETFRRVGKTDIRVEDSGRAAFVAECKVWYGEKELASAIDQLVSYLTWRDCKAAIVVFNKSVAGFTGLLAKIPEAFRAHPFCKRMLKEGSEGEWRFALRAKEDEAREIIVHVFAFNIYVA